MRKNGFTLIELLAVIVILAIIALIATPIILGIINDARQESQERSIELYASAVRNGIATYQLREMKEVAAGSYTSETLPFEVEYDGEVECTTIELYDNGGVYVAGCTVNDLEVDYTYGTKQIIKGKMSSVCKPISVAIEGTYTAGDKYECDVDPNKEGYDYTFYVLTTVEVPEVEEGPTSVNLIMDSNINISGEAVKEGVTDLGLVAWYADEFNNSYGPITAMNHLQTATAGWGNVNPQTVNIFTACDGYDSCEDKTMTEYKVNARMPYLSEVSDYSASANNAYLYDNLHVEYYCYDNEDDYNKVSCDEAGYIDGIYDDSITPISDVAGYWTLSSDAYVSYSAIYVSCGGGYDISDVNIDGYFGVRPVINLSI